MVFDEPAFVLNVSAISSTPSEPKAVGFCLDNELDAVDVSAESVRMAVPTSAAMDSRFGGSKFVKDELLI